MKKAKIYLDDYRIPKNNDWMIVKNYDEFTSVIRNVGLSNIEEIQFDHDLGDKAIMEYYMNTSKTFTIDYNLIHPEMTGYDCAKFLVDFYVDNGYTKEEFPFVYTHSANPVGRANIEGYLNGFFKVNKIDRLCEYRSLPHSLRVSVEIGKVGLTLPNDDTNTE
jgi:hypothetical protein